MKQLIKIIAVIGLFTSCVPEPIDIKVESAPPKLVVFSHAVPNNAMIISLTKSFSLLDGVSEEQYQNMLVSGAFVQVTIDGQVYDFYEIDQGFYASLTSVVPQANEFKLFAVHGNDTITATTNTSAQVSFIDVLPEVDKQPTDTTVHLRIQFDDIANEENFYMINVYRKNEDNNSEFDGVNYFENGSNLLEETILLNDHEFNGSYDVNHTFGGLQHDDSVVVTLSNISKDYYNYLVLRNESGSFFNQLNLEPLNYPTNVENGYGFFNAHSPDIRFFDMSLY